jgi:signal peptidase I
MMLSPFIVPSALVAYTLGPNRARGPSNAPSVLDGDFMLLNRLAYLFGRRPRRGEHVVLKSPDGTHAHKVVVGCPGDRVEVRAGRVTVNGVAFQYAEADPQAWRWVLHVNRLGPIVAWERGPGVEQLVSLETTSGEGAVAACEVPAGHVFVLGSNRPVSKDSRQYGTVPQSRIIGRIVANVSAMWRRWSPPRAPVKDPLETLIDEASALYQRREYPSAIARFTEALSQCPFLDGYQLRGRAYLAMDKLDEALADFEVALRMTPGYTPAIVGVGDVWLERGAHEKAIAAYEEALTAASAPLPPGFAAVILNQRGLARYFKGEYQAAVADREASIALNANLAVAHNNRGAALMKMGQYREALAALHEAIRLDPALPNAHRHLAWLLATCEHPELRDGVTAVQFAIRALELSARAKFEYFEVLAAAHAEAGNFDEAVKWQT